MMVATQNLGLSRTASKRWARRIAIAGAALAVILGVAFAMRCTLLLHVARIFLDRDAELVAQEKADGVTIVFATPPAAWVAPMKNVMNPMWQPIAATGVNSSWPPGTDSFQDVALDGYFVCWPDATRGVSIVVYGVAAHADDRLPTGPDGRRDIRSEILSVMKTAKLKAMR